MNARVRRYDRQSMDDLIARSRAADDEPIELDYLIDALEHYRQMYGRILRRYESLYEDARYLAASVRETAGIGDKVWRELESSYQELEGED